MGPADLSDLAVLFGGQRNTRHCWCMAPCTTRAQFAAGWVTGGNRRRFEIMAAAGDQPMGVLAYEADEPVGWCACGPRSRYAGGEGRRRTLLRGQAVELARQHGALAIEGWPVTGPDVPSGDAFVGRERMFEDLGFRCVARPGPRRAIVRRELSDA